MCRFVDLGRKFQVTSRPESRATYTPTRTATHFHIGHPMPAQHPLSALLTDLKFQASSASGKAWLRSTSGSHSLQSCSPQIATPGKCGKPWVSVGTWYGMTKLPCRASAGGVEDPHACAMGIMQRPRFPRGPRPRGMRRILAVSRPRRCSLANLGAEEIRQNRDVVVAGGTRCGPTTNRPIGGVCLVPGFLPVPVLLVFLFGSVDGPPASRSGWPPTMAFFFLESQSNRAMR